MTDSDVGSQDNRVTHVGTEDAARLLGVSARTVRRLIALGKLRARRPGPRITQIDLTEIARYLRATTTAAEPEGEP